MNLKKLCLMLLFLLLLFSCNNSSDHVHNDEEGIAYKVVMNNGKVVKLESAVDTITDEDILKDLNEFYSKMDLTPEDGEVITIQSETGTRGTCDYGHTCTIYSEEGYFHYHYWPRRCYSWKRVYRCINCSFTTTHTGHTKK